jgi:AraC-like DNA-binding protein
MPQAASVSHCNIIRIEDTLLPAHRPVTYSRRSFYKISVVQGQGNIHYADRSFAIRDKALVFTNPLIPFHWELLDTQQQGYVCLFTPDFFGQQLQVGAMPAFQHPEAAVLSLDQEQYEYFAGLFAKAYAELHGDYAYKYDLLRSQLISLVHEGQKLQPAIAAPVPTGQASERIAALFTELLNRQFPIELSNQVLQLRTAADFAAKLHVHVNHLNKALREITGRSTSQLVQERVLTEAKILLRSTSWSVAEIAWCLGYEAANHFSAFFKAQLQLTPSQFRRQGAAD